MRHMVTRKTVRVIAIASMWRTSAKRTIRVPNSKTTFSEPVIGNRTQTNVGRSRFETPADGSKVFDKHVSQRTIRLIWEKITDPTAEKHRNTISITGLEVQLLYHSLIELVWIRERPKREIMQGTKKSDVLKDIAVGRLINPKSIRRV